jgi:hypothetical protein
MKKIFAIIFRFLISGVIVTDNPATQIPPTATIKSSSGQNSLAETSAPEVTSWTSPRNASHSAIPLGLSSPRSFARNMPSNIVARAYRYPLAMRLSFNPVNRWYKVLRSNISPVLHPMAIFLLLLDCLLTKA